MLFKRLHDTTGDAPRVIGLEIGHTGKNAAQNFSTGFVEEAMAGGYARIEGDTLLLSVHDDGKPVVLRYAIKRRPGRHETATGPEVIHAYECELDAAQHAEYRLPDGMGALSMSIAAIRARRAA